MTNKSVTETGSRFSIRNPLSVIGIFAGLVEVSGTVVLPQLQPAVQYSYVWFLMGFPSLLVLLFFIVLWKKHYVFYAPLDFRSDQSFTEMIVPGSASDRVKRVLSEDINLEPNTDSVAARRQLYANALFAEELVVARLNQISGITFERNGAFASNPQLAFDAIGRRGNETRVLEVKYARSGSLPRRVVEAAFSRINAAYQSLDGRTRSRFNVDFAIVADAADALQESKTTVQAIAAQYPFGTTVHAFSLDSLQADVVNLAAESDSQEELGQRIVGLLAVEEMNHFELLRALQTSDREEPSKRDIQVAVGRLVEQGKIEKGSLGRFRLPGPSF